MYYYQVKLVFYVGKSGLTFEKSTNLSYCFLNGEKYSYLNRCELKKGFDEI